jgi:fluoroquinolone resistance protein
MILQAGKEFENQTFKKINCLDRDLKAISFVHCHFDNCDWTQSNLTGSKFLDCTLHNCNLSLVKLDGCRLQGVNFQNCKFMGVNFGTCDPMFLAMKFIHCLIGTSNFSDLDLKGTAFLNCTIRDTHFTHSNLTEANFEGSDLRGTIFHNSNLTQPNFIGAINYAINPLTNQLKGAKFSKPEVLSLLDHLGIEIEE